MDSPGKVCKDPHRPANAVIMATVVLIAIILIYYLAQWVGGKRKEGFVSQKAHEIYNTSKPLFDEAKGNVSYSTFKTRVPGTDPVTYTDVRRLWSDGKLSPETVQKVL